MKIVQVHKYWWHRDGASNYALQLTELLESRGHEVVPFGMLQKETLETGYNDFFVPEMRLSQPGKLSIAQKVRNATRIIHSRVAKKKMAALLDTVKPDVVHIHNIYHHISPSIFSEIKKRGIPIVMTLHDYKLVSPNYTMFHHGRIQERDHAWWYLKCIANKCLKDSYVYSAVIALEMMLHHKIFDVYRHVDRFIAPSHFMKDICVRYGWEPHRFTVLPHPIDSTKHKAHYNDDGSVLYLGRLSEEKGVGVLIGAARMTSHIRYNIVGTGPLLESLKQTCESGGLANVRFTGFKTGKALDTLLQQARIVVVPSIWYENYPLSILEAKAMGKMVVGSDIGGIPELIDKRFLVPPGDAQALAAKIDEWHQESPKKRKAVGEHNRVEVERINDPSTHISRVEKLYTSLI